MSEDAEWGPWIDHDGKGCPVKGQMVESVQVGGVARVHIAHGVIMNNGRVMPAGTAAVDSWDWSDCIRFGRAEWRIIRYRVRKPKGMIILQELLEKLPSDVKAREPA